MKKEIEKDLSEDVLDENDLIINPANISRIARGFIPKQNIVKDHEVQMAKSDLYQAAKNSVRIFELIKDKSEDEGIEGWVQEKIIKAADYLNTVREYLEGEQIQEGPVADLVTNTGMDPGKAFYTVQLDKILEPAPSTSSEKTEESMDGVAPSTRMFASESKKSKSNTCESCGQKWKFSHLCENEDESSLEEGKTGPGLWANIRARKASGKPMRKKGQKGAPSEEALKAARKGSTNEEQEMTEDSINEYDITPGREEDSGSKFIPWQTFIKGLAFLLKDNFTLQMSSQPEQVKARFVPIDPMEYGPSQVYAYNDPRLTHDKKQRGVGVQGMMHVGKYHQDNNGKLLTAYHNQELEGSKWIQFTLANIPKVAAIIADNKKGAVSQNVSEEKDACYHKVKSRYKVWPSAYASGALVKCRKVGAKNWGNKSKK